MITTSGERFSDDEVQKMIQAAGGIKNGKVKMDEFIKAMMSFD